MNSSSLTELTEIFGDVADAIREKLGTQTTYSPRDFATAIASISGGGGGGGTNYYAWRDSMGYVHFSDSVPTRTHYVIAVSQPSLVIVPIFDGTISDWSEEQSDPVPVYYSDIEVDEHLTAGQHYTVTFDNVEYQLTAYDDPEGNGDVWLGENLWGWDGTSPISAPFLFSVTNEEGGYWGYIAVLSDASHAIRVEEAT